MMRLLKIFRIIFLGLMAFTTMNAHAGQGDLIQQMKSGGYILMIRHAYAPGTGDPAHFKIGDCTTQRNLDNSGRGVFLDFRSMNNLFLKHVITPQANKPCCRDS
jgi:hypothetical protein